MLWFLELEMAILAFLIRPARLVRMTGEPAKRLRKLWSAAVVEFGSVSMAKINCKSSSEPAIGSKKPVSASGEFGISLIGLALDLLYGQTSWQISQPKIKLPILLASSGSIGRRCSIVR